MTPALSIVPNWPSRRERKRAFAFQLRLGLDREARPRNRFQARLGNRLAGQFADAVGLLLDALERLLDFINRVLVRRQQAQGEIAVEIVRAGIRHVQAVTRHFLGGLLGQPVHLVEQLVAQFQQPVVILLPLRLDPFRRGDRPGLRHRMAEDGCRRRRNWRIAAWRSRVVFFLLRCHS